MGVGGLHEGVSGLGCMKGSVGSTKSFKESFSQPFMFQGEGGNQGARQALEAVFEGLGLPNASEAQASQGGGEGEQGGEGENTGGSGGEGEQERQEREEREQQEQEEDAYEQMLLENAGKFLAPLLFMCFVSPS